MKFSHPCFFVSYFAGVIEKIVSNVEGFHVGVHNISIFLYIDDLCRVQHMMNIVAIEMTELDMAVNTGESYCLCFERKRQNKEKICFALDGTQLNWRNEANF